MLLITVAKFIKRFVYKKIAHCYRAMAYETKIVVFALMLAILCLFYILIKTETLFVSCTLLNWNLIETMLERGIVRFASDYLNSELLWN